MIRTTHMLTALGAAIATAAAAASFTVPAALAGTASPDRLITDTLGGNGRPAARVMCRHATPSSRAEAVACALRNVNVPLSAAVLRGIERAKAGTPAVRFTTDTLAPGGGIAPLSVPVNTGFAWRDATIGAATMFGLVLLTVAGGLLALRSRGRLAF